MRKEEIIASVQQLTFGLNNMADSLEELDAGGLYVYADMIQQTVGKLASAASELNSYATDVHALHQAVQDAKSGGQL